MRLTPAQKRDLAIGLFRQRFPGSVAEHRFHAKRKWMFDYAWADKKIALEYEGGIFKRGRHTRAIGYDKDCEKYNTAALMGWVVIRITPIMLRDGRALRMLEWAHNNYNNAEKKRG